MPGSGILATEILPTFSRPVMSQAHKHIDQVQLYVSLANEKHSFDLGLELFLGYSG